MSSVDASPIFIRYKQSARLDVFFYLVSCFRFDFYLWGSRRGAFRLRNLDLLRLRWTRIQVDYFYVLNVNAWIHDVSLLSGLSNFTLT